MDNISGTKELIFDSFVELISALGYENVSMRDIAEKVGIKVASLYNHFESKQSMLDYAYNYYSLHYFDNRKTIEEMKKIVETAGAEEIVYAFASNFMTEDQKKYVRMILITKIIYMRLFQDAAANKMYYEHNINDIEYVENILQYGIDIGRLDPGFDLATFADILIGSMTIMGINAFAGTAAYQARQLDQEKGLLAMLTRLFSTALLK